jgi:hypothetical protein
MKPSTSHQVTFLGRRTGVFREPTKANPERERLLVSGPRPSIADGRAEALDVLVAMARLELGSIRGVRGGLRSCIDGVRLGLRCWVEVEMLCSVSPEEATHTLGGSQRLGLRIDFVQSLQDTSLWSSF